MDQNRELLLQVVDTEINFEDYLGILFRRKVLIFVMMILIFLPFFYLGLIQPFFYETKIIAVIEEKNEESFMPGSQYQRYMRRSNRRSPGYYNLIVQSQPFKESLKTKLREELLKKENVRYSDDKIGELLRSSIVFERFTGGLFHQGGMVSNACQLRVVSSDPNFAFHLANVGFEVLKVKSVEIENKRTLQMLSFIEEQKKLLEEKILENEKEIIKFRNETGISVSDDLAGVEREVRKIQERQLDSRTQWELEEAKLKAIDEQIREYDQLLKAKYNVKVNYDTSALRKQHKDLLKKKNKYMENPVVFKKELDKIEEELSDVTSKIVKQILSGTKKKRTASFVLNVTHYTELMRKKDEATLNIRMLKSQEKYYSRLYEKYRIINPELLEQKTRMAKLSLTKSVLGRTYNIFVEREQQEKISTISTSTELKLINPAPLPGGPLPRSTRKYWMVGLALAIVISFSMAFFIELFDTTIKTPEDVKKALLLPTLGIIPKIAERPIEDSKDKSVDQNLITYLKPSNQVSEAYRTLRTNLEHIDPLNNLKSFLVTSPSPFEGKSVSISNLAILFAQKDLKVLLMDLDLRKPKVHKIFNIDKKPGLVDVLNEPDLSYEKHLKKTPIENLHVLPVGHEIDKPAEILGSKKFDQLFERLKNDFDIVLLDTPPVNVVTDAALIATKVDGVLIVVCALQTNKNSAKYCIELLSRVKANVLGVLLNKILISKRYGSYGYYYYKRYYRSYYSYYHKSPD